MAKEGYKVRRQGCTIPFLDRNERERTSEGGGELQIQIHQGGRVSAEADTVIAYSGRAVGREAHGNRVNGGGEPWH